MIVKSTFNSLSSVPSTFLFVPTKIDNKTITEQVRIDNGSDFAITGYHIKEWNTKADGTGQTYGLNASITLWQNLTLYAIWEA